MKHFNFLLFAGFFMLATPGQAQPKSAYQQELENWQKERVSELKADDGWLNLVGLFWLDEGKSAFGSGKQNKVVFPAGTIAAEAGYFVRTGNSVSVTANDGVTIAVDKKPVKTAVVFNGDGQSHVVSSGDLQWTIIKREDKIGIRLRNLKSAAVKNFKGLEMYPADTTWRLSATLVSGAQPASVLITNVLGQTTAQQSPGKLQFSIGGKPYTLDALEEGDNLFIIFADSTNGNTTYPSGRFLSVKKPGQDGFTIIDFNKSYNPPCAVTPFATCPLPPKQNDLPVAVTAGEKYTGHP